jgi:hypothetical protein
MDDDVFSKSDWSKDDDEDPFSDPSDDDGNGNAPALKGDLAFENANPRNLRALTEKSEGKPSYKCLLCLEGHRKVFWSSDDFEYHVSEKHCQRYDFKCPQGDWAGETEIDLWKHWQSAHWDLLLSETEIEFYRIQLGSPSACCICSTPVSDWTHWFSCLRQHCQHDEPDDNRASQPIIEYRNSVSAGDGSSNSANMLIFEEDYLLQTIVALNQRDVLDNHLASSDFVSTFSATLVRRVIPANFDQETMETFLTALPDIILDFLDKLLFSGVDICTQFAETVWQKRRYVL